MESNDRDDGTPGDPDAHHNRDFEPMPPAPLPAHERTWRHPSELGADTVQVAAAPQPAISRRATVATVAAGVLLVVAAVRLMAPASTSTSSADGGTVLTITAGGGAVATSTQVAPVATDGPRSSLTAGATFLATTTLVSYVAPATWQPVPTHELTVGDDAATYAVVLDSGRYLATTAAAVDGLDLVEVHLPSGDTIQATVVRSDGPIALLDMSGVSAAPAPHGEPPDLGAFVAVGTPDGDAAAVIGEPNDHGYPQLLSDQPLHDSGPVYDGEGALVGICTHGADEQDWLVPVGMLDQMAADQGDGVPAASTTTAAPTSSTGAATTTSSASTTAATTTTVVTAPSAAPSTSAPRSSTSTSAPRTTSTSSIPPTATPTTVG